MAISKVVFGTSTLIDLSEDTVSPETLGSGITAHAANGELITGTASAASGTTQWGTIEGTLSDQTDLKNELDTKVNIIDCGGIQVRPNYTISNVDLVDGVSQLQAGKLYFYYEE